MTNVHLYVDGDYGGHSTWRMDLSFGYLANSMVSSITDNLGGAAQTYSFSYDPLNRLSGWTTGAGLSCGFSMDEYGNVAASRGSSPCGMPIALSFNAANNRILGDVYSAAGQLLSDTVGSNYTWDAAGRLVGFTAPGEQASYRYDGLGRRIESTVDGLSSIYVYDPLGHRVADESGGAWTDYVVTPEGERLAVIAGSGAAAPVHYLHLGPLGTTRVITDAAGNNAVACGQNSSYPDGSLLTYAPYGAALDCAQGLTPFQFTGKPRDAESGLDDFGARFYSSMQGRYLSPDWSDTPDAVPYSNLADPQSLNLYAYAGDSPLSFNDPWGHYLQAPRNCGNPCEVKAKPIPVLTRAYLEARQALLLMLAFDVERIHSDIQHPVTHIALPFLLGFALGPEGGEAAEPLEEGASTLIEDVTRKGAREVSERISMSKEEFEANLEANGFQKTTKIAESGQVVDQFTKDGAKYDVYRATSTHEPTAQFTPPGSGRVTLKIRLKGGGE